MNYCTLLIGIGHREQVFQWAGSVGEISARLKVESKLLSLGLYHFFVMPRIWPARGAIEPLREKTANPLPCCAALIFGIEHGTAPS
jgi:hypothetical protein